MQTIRHLLFLTGGLLLLSGSFFASDPSTHLQMPDGQLSIYKNLAVIKKENSYDLA